MANSNVTLQEVAKHHNFKNLLNQRFGRLTVIAFDGRSPVGTQGRQECRWLCRCDCGQERSVTSNCLTTGHTSSCGCLHRETTAALSYKHGHSRRAKTSPTFKSWAGMVARCTNSTLPDYSNYGGRGITVCDRWRESFEAFLADMGERPTANHSINRIDNSKGYEPGNCRWATRSQQAQNKRNNHLITIDGVTLCLSEWCRRTGVPVTAAIARINRGWPASQAVSDPVGTYRLRRVFRNG